MPKFLFYILTHIRVWGKHLVDFFDIFKVFSREICSFFETYGLILVFTWIISRVKIYSTKNYSGVKCMKKSIKIDFLNADFGFFVLKNSHPKIEACVKYCAEVVGKVTGKTPAVKIGTPVINSVLFATFDKILLKNSEHELQKKALIGSDGYAVLYDEGTVYVLSHTVDGVCYGAYGLLEDNLDIVWGRGAEDYAFDYLPTQFVIKKFDYIKKSPFRYRVWNMCGHGSTDKGHYDSGTAACYARNKINGLFHEIDDSWKEYGITGFGVVAPKANNIDDLINDYPEYFMTDVDGTPKRSANAESFINYYNKDVAKVVAKRFVDFLNSGEADPDCIYNLIMPDNPYFCVCENGIKISDKPFVTDDGVTVYPSDKNYKSTVYFNYMNRVTSEINRLRPNTEVLTFAYLYSEAVPAVKTNENLIVSLAPIYTNEKYAYNDNRGGTGNEEIAKNIENWAKVCKKLCVYTYWNSFQGTIYMRPILKQIKADLLWFQKLGVYGLTPEGKLDCTLLNDMSDDQKNSRKFFDMNEACTFVINKLMWNPSLDEEELLARYAKIVYKEVANEFIEYYRLIEQGFNSKDAYVWYPTGGDVYNLQFVVEAGIKDKVIKVLEQAKEKAVTLTVKSRINSIYETVKAQIDKYADFVREDGYIVKTSASEEEILSQSAMDYRNNPDSVWNKATPMKVLRNYSTMEFYPKEADFECRMLVSGENLYVGYSVKDARVVKTDYDVNGNFRALKENGEQVISYAETYIGGNELNKSVYYGYIIGFCKQKGGNFYQNDGVPKNVGDKGLKDEYFVKLSSNLDERYLFHVQVIPITALGVAIEDFKPYGSFVYYNDGHGRAGWMGFGLWSKQNFQTLKITEEI